MDSRGLDLHLVQQVINSLTYCLLREDYFPLTLTLSPIGGEGKDGTDFGLCRH